MEDAEPSTPSLRVRVGEVSVKLAPVLLPAASPTAPHMVSRQIVAFLCVNSRKSLLCFVGPRKRANALAELPPMTVAPNEAWLDNGQTVADQPSASWGREAGERSS